MKKYQILAASLLITTGIMGCAQQTVPPPYPRQPVTPVEQPEDAQQAATSSEQGPNAPLDPVSSSIRPEIDTSALGAKAKPLSAGFISDRIRFYNERLEILKKLDASSDITAMDPQQTRIMFNCSRDLQRLIDGYQGIHDTLFRGSAVDQVGYENMIALQRLDIAFLDSSCAEMLGDKKPAAAAVMSGGQGNERVRIEAEIDNYFMAGAYAEVLQAWAQLPAYQQAKVSYNTALQYGDALMQLDQPAQSAAVYQQVLDRIAAADAPAADPLRIRKRLADLHTAAGNFFEAEQQYEQLIEAYEQIGGIETWARLHLSLLGQSMKGSPELVDYTELLRAYLGFVPAADGFSVAWKAEEFSQTYPYSPVSENVDIIKAETLARADQWFAALMQQTEGLVAEKSFAEAIALLKDVPADKLSPENLVLLNEKLDNLMLAEAVDRETVKIEKMQELQRIWNDGMVHADAGDFPEAIAVFEQLQGTDYEIRAAEKIAELALTASKIERRKAADLFVRSTKTQELPAKKQLLIESRQTLKDILENYPDVEVADKVRGNIRQVEKKMNEIDPLLLPELEAQEREQQMRQGLVDDEIRIEGFDVDTPETPSTDQPKKAVLPIYTPQALQ